jgi:hypothetical protein
LAHQFRADRGSEPACDAEREWVASTTDTAARIYELEVYA